MWKLPHSLDYAQSGEILPPRGHLVKSRDIWVVIPGEVLLASSSRGPDAAKHPTMNWTVPPQKELFGPKCQWYQEWETIFAKGSDHLFITEFLAFTLHFTMILCTFSYHLWWKHLAWKFTCLKNTSQEGIFKMKNGKRGDLGKYVFMFYVLTMLTHTN